MHFIHLDNHRKNLWSCHFAHTCTHAHTLSWYLFNCHTLGTYLKLPINRLWDEIFHFTTYSSLDPTLWNVQNYPYLNIHCQIRKKYSTSKNTDASFLIFEFHFQPLLCYLWIFYWAKSLFFLLNLKCSLTFDKFHFHLFPHSVCRMQNCLNQ